MQCRIQTLTLGGEGVGQSSRPLDKGGGRSPKKFLQPFEPQFGLKIRGDAPPLTATTMSKYSQRGLIRMVTPWDFVH